MTFFRLATSDEPPRLRPHGGESTCSIGTRRGRDRSGARGLQDRSFGRGVRRARNVLNAAGTPFLYEADRAFAKSLHVLDPDGNEIEFYIEKLGLSGG